MAHDQAQKVAAYTQVVSHLRGLIIDHVRHHATMEELVQISVICNPAVAEIIQEVRNDG
jgi:hypothetical protein